MARPRLSTGWSNRLALVGILGLYASLSFYQVNLPGLHYDEAFEAVPALQLLSGQPVTAFRHSGLNWGGRLFPLMTQDYIGAINTYLAIPFIYFLGPTPLALRAMSILLGGLTISLACVLTRRLTGSTLAALTTALLLAVEPTFIFWNRQGVFVTAVTATIGLAATLSWLAWWQTGRTTWLMAGAFLFGLGLYAKFLFLWLIAALVGGAFLLSLPGFRQGWNILPRLLTRTNLLAIPAFLVGCWPFILYNVQTGGTLIALSRNATTSYYGVNNLAFGPNLAERIGQFIGLLSGSQFWYLGRVVSNPIGPTVFALVVGLGLVNILTTRKQAAVPDPAQQVDLLPPGRAAVFPFLVIGLVILASIGTISALWTTHYAILMPWPAIAMVTGSHYYLRRSAATRGDLRPFKYLRPLVQLGLGLLIITNFASTLRYHAALAESGGLSSHSDAVYDLSDWLARRATGPVVAMDWGLAAPVTYLTGGRVTPTEVFGYAWESDVELNQRLESFIAQPATLYLWRAPDEIIFDRSGQFKALYRPLGLEEAIEEAFYERSGRPILGITRLVRQGTPGINRPQ